MKNQIYDSENHEEKKGLYFNKKDALELRDWRETGEKEYLARTKTYRNV